MPLLETKGSGSAQGFGLTAGSTERVYVEDVFSTYLYTGNGTTNTITNGINLSGKGGLVWIKSINAAFENYLFDTARGAGNYLMTQATTAQDRISSSLSSFNSNGFGIPSASYYGVNNPGTTFASWTFRKQPKFFDVVTYTGTGVGRTVAHNLGSVPGCIIVKRTDTTSDWQVYHRSLANTEYMVLNSTAAKATGATRWNSTTPTSTVFSLGTDATVNANGGTYVAYLFAHDAGGFGLSGADNVISCSSLVTSASASTYAAVNLGWEPQWILIKNTTTSGNWQLVDNMRALNDSGTVASLFPNATTNENSYSSAVRITATGFEVNSAFLGTSQTLVYIAIRRGPMKTPTSGTSVFKALTRTGTTSTFTGVGFSPDLMIDCRTNSTSGTDNFFIDRLRGPIPYVLSLGSSAEAADTGINGVRTFTMDGFTAVGTVASGNNVGNNYIDWFFRRAPSFFDQVCYTGTGANRTVAHNLGVAPELMIVKNRSSAVNWAVGGTVLGSGGNVLLLNTTGAVFGNQFYWNNTLPTSSVFSISIGSTVNTNGSNYVAYLFASCPGVSKVGSYTGTGTTLQIDCGFTAGARFVMIKRTDSTGDWYVWDSARGIVAGNDPYKLLNSGAVEVTSTDYVDTYSAGFEISSTAPAEINANGGTFIFLAIA